MTRIAIDIDMASSITCHRAVSPAAGGYDHYGANNHSSSIDLAASALAATTTPLCPNPGHDLSQSSSLAVPSLDIPPAAADKSPACHSFDLADGVYLLSAASGSVDTVTAHNMAGPPTPPPSDKLRTPKRKRTVSPPSAKSPGEIRSTSRSTRRSGHSRQSSLHSHRRTNTATSLTPSVPSSPVQRENLLALHRESCRLFQDTCQLPSPPQSPQQRTFSEPSSPRIAPIQEYQSRPSHSSSSHHENQEPEQPVEHFKVEVISSVETKPTIMEWTSPSTRRREYKEIDRASSGVRGLWRRVAPRWCQFGNTRVPFFEEDKDGKANYEGSVRRFRMDLPDEPIEQRRRVKIRPKLAVHAIGGKNRRSKTAWL
ncbi:hypothetical protein BDV18DRAFT_116452 [Aspergillus unguis]